LNRQLTVEDYDLDPDARQRFFGQADHVRVYGRDYKDRLETSGFIVRVDEYAKDLGISRIEKFSLSEDERVYFCVKPTQSISKY